jgi:hypothetical protein
MPRKRVTQSTIQGMAGEVAGLPLAPDRAKLHAEVLEGLMSEIARLRELPLKEVEPAFVYRPVELKAGKRK